MMRHQPQKNENANTFGKPRVPVGLYFLIQLKFSHIHFKKGQTDHSGLTSVNAVHMVS